MAMQQRKVCAGGGVQHDCSPGFQYLADVAVADVAVAGVAVSKAMDIDGTGFDALGVCRYSPDCNFL